MEQVKTVLESIAVAVDLVGIAILIFAALKFVIHYLKFEFKRLKGLDSIEGIRNLRLGLGSYILLALEFIIVSDVIHSVVSTNIDDLLSLGLVVIVRIALSFFLGRELYEVKTEH